MTYRLQTFDTFLRTLFHKDYESLVQFDSFSTSIVKIGFEKSENLVMSQLCRPVVAIRHKVGTSLYAQKIPARILKMLRKNIFQIMVFSHRGSSLKKSPKSDYLGSP